MAYEQLLVDTLPLGLVRLLEAQAGLGFRIGGRFGPSGFAEYALHLWNLSNQTVRLLQHLGRLARRQARQGGGHVQHVAFIQGRHELAPEPEHREKACDQ